MTEQRPGRRQFLASAGLLAGGAAIGAAGSLGLDHRSTQHDPPTSGPTATVAFEGAHQPGIVDRQPAVLRFLSLDLTPAVTGPAALQTALRQLSAAARAAMAGNWPSVSAELAAGLQLSGLTVTIGVGASALGKAALPVPDQLRPLPVFDTDHLQAARSGGDLGIQLCADDPMAVGAAVRALLGSLAGLATLRWSQGGFLRGTAAVDPAATPRNLMGQLDGTDNPTGARRDLAVWVPPGVSPSWMAGGSYLVCRRIRMLLDSWERLGGAAQEAAVGRRKDTGAPLTGQREHDNPDFAAEQAGRPVIAANAHLRLTHPANNSGATMLRRGYSYDDGVDATGSPDAGLFFQSFQTDPHQVFVPIQRKLAASDALGSFLRHEASALFAMPPGASPGGFVGERLF